MDQETQTDGYENKRLDSSIDEKMDAMQSFAMEFGNFSLDKIWIPPVENTKLFYYKTKVALTDTNFIGSDQHLLANRMFSIDGEKQDKQNGMDQHWIEPNLENNTSAISFGKYPDKIWIGQTVENTKLLYYKTKVL